MNLGIMQNICDRPWEFAVEPFRVAGKVFYIGDSWVASYLIDTGAGLILIDAMMPQCTYLLLENIRKLGYDPADIKILLLSHAHYDHCGGATAISKLTGCKIYMGKEDLFFLTDRPDLIFVANNWFTPFQVDEFYDEHKPVHLGNISIETIHTPGHTPGTYSFFFDVEEKGITYRCGMHGGIGVNTLDDEYFQETGLPISLRDDFERSLLHLRNEKVDIALGSHANHTDMLGKARRMTEQHNPFIDGSAFGQLIDARMEDFRRVCHRA